MQGSIIAQGVELMLYGMGTVLVFLALLVVATTLMSRCLNRLFPEPELVRAPPGRGAGSVGAGQDPAPEVVAAIGAALHRHRSGRQKGP